MHLKKFIRTLGHGEPEVLLDPVVTSGDDLEWDQKNIEATTEALKAELKREITEYQALMEETGDAEDDYEHNSEVDCL